MGGGGVISQHPWGGRSTEKRPDLFHGRSSAFQQNPKSSNGTLERASQTWQPLFINVPRAGRLS